ncbi:MAG: biotin--[acetyl-CoA-carboxylase] ligase [Pseudomonadota bacterium]|nr:biotin--[acetyl-CoA-carboxylase] ligase [Pseudomonadota bacterium]
MLLHRYDTVTSTQVVARGLAEAGAPHGTVVLAEEQTAGRGRLDRRWDSARGLNLTFTLVLRPRIAARDAPLLTLGAAAGLAVAFDLRVKWPNDLVTGEGKKVAGLLAEMDMAGDRVGFVLLGVGLNVNQVDFPAALPNATSLAEISSPQDRTEVLERAVSAILAWCDHPDRLSLWRQRAHTLGKHVQIGHTAGVATALRDDGALIVGGVPVLAGEIG